MSRSLLWVPLASVVCFPLTPQSLLAQESCDSGATLRGVAREVETGVRIGFAQVSLQSVDGDEVITTRTDPSGAFALCGLDAGRYELTAALAEYTAGPTAVDVSAAAAEDRVTLEIALAMSAEAIALDTISVAARARDLDPSGFAGFEERRASGFGVFVLAEQIQQRNPTRLTEMLHEAGVAVQNNGQQIYMRRTGCSPLVYIDGVRITHLSRGGSAFASSGVGLLGPKGGSSEESDDPTFESAAAVNMAHPSSVRAVEVYRSPGETPSEYLDSNARCGVILIWTWRGAPRG